MASKEKAVTLTATVSANAVGPKTATVSAAGASYTTTGTNTRLAACGLARRLIEEGHSFDTKLVCDTVTLARIEMAV
jgi:hypothetical protein